VRAAATYHVVLPPMLCYRRLSDDVSCSAKNSLLETPDDTEPQLMLLFFYLSTGRRARGFAVIYSPIGRRVR
jgi:hypothetical protein